MVTGFNVYHQIAPHPLVTIEIGLCVTSETVLLGFCGYRISVEWLVDIIAASSNIKGTKRSKIFVYST
jgi:hypothetical protein